MNVEDKLYGFCLKELKDIMKREEYSDLSASTKIYSMYKLAGKDYQRTRFFWDTFTLEELKTAISVKIKEAASHAK